MTCEVLIERALFEGHINSEWRKSRRLDIVPETPGEP